MTIYTIEKIQRLEKQLKERFEKLCKQMLGRELSGSEAARYGNSKDLRDVSSEEVRIATDDFATILKEIKATLGKR